MANQLEFKILAPLPAGAHARNVARQRRALTKAIHSMQRLIDRLPAEELAFITTHLEKALERQEKAHRKPQWLSDLVPDVSPRDRLGKEIEVLQRSFRRRQELLRDSLSTIEVAEVLGTSRQTPHDRAESGSLLAVLDRGALRFPAWQFDPTGPNGVIEGLSEVLKVLMVTPFAKLSWLVRPTPTFEGKTPLSVLQKGHIDRVVKAARAVEAD